MEAWDLWCSKPAAKCTLQYQSDLYLSVAVLYWYTLLYNALELQVRMNFGVVTKVSTFFVITQVSSGLKRSHILICSKYKYLHVKFSQCKILCHRRPIVWLCTVSVDYLSGIAL